MELYFPIFATAGKWEPWAAEIRKQLAAPESAPVVTALKSLQGCDPEVVLRLSFQAACEWLDSTSRSGLPKGAYRRVKDMLKSIKGSELKNANLVQKLRSREFNNILARLDEGMRLDRDEMLARSAYCGWLLDYLEQLHARRPHTNFGLIAMVEYVRLRNDPRYKDLELIYTTSFQALHRRGSSDQESIRQHVKGRRAIAAKVRDGLKKNTEEFERWIMLHYDAPTPLSTVAKPTKKPMASKQHRKRAA